MTSNGKDSSQKPTTDELKQWARAPQPAQPLVAKSEFTPEKASQPRPISGHPLIKIALVGGLTLPIFVVAGLMMNANRPTAPIATQPIVSPSPSNTDENSDAKTIAAQREALGQTQANYALKEQQDRLKQQSVQKQGVPQTVASTKTPIKPVRQNANVEAQPVSYPSTPIVQRIQPPITPPPQISKPTPIAQSLPASQSEQNDYDRYLALTQIGSYGQLSANEPTSPASSDSVNEAIANKPAESFSLASLPREAEINTEEVAILQEQPQGTVLASAKVEGILATPIIVDEKTKSSGKAGHDRITIQLTEPLRTQANAVVLPKGTQLIAELSSLSDSGLVQLNVASAIVDQNGQQVEIKIPPEAIQITGHEGQPLIAKQYGDKGKAIAAIDAGKFLLGGLSKASEQFTRPQSSSIVSNNTGIISNVQNSKPNLLAGILQGGSEALLSSIEQRNQRAIQEIAQQPNIRFLPAGSSVDIYINQSVSLPIALMTASSQIPEISWLDRNDSPFVDQETKPTSRTKFAIPTSAVSEPTASLIPEWSIFYETESSSEPQFNHNQLNRTDCNTSNLTCENNYR